MRSEPFLDAIACSTLFGFNSLWSTSRATTSSIVFRLHHVVDFLRQILRHFCVIDFWDVHLSILPKWEEVLPFVQRFS